MSSTVRPEKNLSFGCYVSGGATRLQRLMNRHADELQDIVTIVHDGEYHPAIAETATRVNADYLHVGGDELRGVGNRKAENLYVSDKILSQFILHGVDYGLCFGGRILSGQLLTKYRLRIVNFHPSLLPAFPGLKAIDQARERKSFLYGNTAHFIDEGVDTGPVIMQSIIHAKMVSDYDDVLDLQIPMAIQIMNWLRADIVHVRGGEVTIDSADYTQTVYYPKLDSRS